MLRLTVLLCAAMFVTLLIAGEDKGQMRPGLALALAQGEEIVVIKRRWADEVALPAAEPAVADGSASPAVMEAAVLVEEPAPLETASVETASVETAPAESAGQVTPQPVFTLSDLPAVSMDTTTAPAEDAADAPAQAAGEVWYVAANSVNVREGPSTETSVIDKLTRGEAVTVSFEPGSEWAQVSIEGDGLEGYVALRFLTPEAP